MNGETVSLNEGQKQHALCMVRGWREAGDGCNTLTKAVSGITQVQGYTGKRSRWGRLAMRSFP